MPFGDRTGPAGMGPRTGRGAGYCSGFDYPGYVAGPGFGGGRGRGFGRGFGWRAGFRPGFGPFWGYYNSPVPFQYSPDQEKDYLKDQISGMEKTIENLKTRLDEIDEKE